MRPGDLFIIWLIWYSVVRFALEPLRTANWTVDRLPTASVITVAFTVVALVGLVWRHRPSAGDGDRWDREPAVEQNLMT